MIPDANTAATLGVSVVLHNSCLKRLAATLRQLRVNLLSAINSGQLRDARVTLIDNGSDEAYRSELHELCAACLEPAPGGAIGSGDHDSGDHDCGDHDSGDHDSGDHDSGGHDSAADARVAVATSQARLAIRWHLALEDTNHGFGVAHNHAQSDAHEDYLLILNPDVELADDALQKCLAWMATAPDAVAVNPRCTRPDESPEYLCKRYPTLFDLFLRGFGGRRLRARFTKRLGRYEYRDYAKRVTPWRAELLSGACLLCRRSAFKACGGFDPAFFLYFEDFDLSRRLAVHGDLCCLPAMAAVHHGGDAARKGWRHRRWFIVSAWRFFARHGWRLF